MVTDKQVRKLFQILLDARTIVRAARLTDMDEKTARKYRDLGKLPSEVAKPQQFAGHSDPKTTLGYIRNRDRLSTSPAYVLQY